MWKVVQMVRQPSQNLRTYKADENTQKICTRIIILQPRVYLAHGIQRLGLHPKATAYDSDH